MLLATAWVLSIAVVAGAILAGWHLRATDNGSRPPPAAGIVHGVVGIVGFIGLLLTLAGPSRAVDTGAGSFGTSSAVLLGVAAVLGISMLVLRQKALVMAIHGLIAVTGYVLFLAWDASG